jgi:ribosomal protein S18 acetylase RimI-like enzyme
VRELGTVGAFVVDVNVSFELDRPATLAASPAGVEVRVAQPQDHAAALDVAGSCYRYSRFHLDPLVGQESAHRIKREWCSNYARGARGDKLFVASLDGGQRAVGFLAALVAESNGQRTAVIDLVGVDPRCQRRQIGTALTSAFVEHYRQNCAALQVGTQAANVPSIRMYERLGFSLIKSAYVMHLHVEHGEAVRV